MNALTGRKVPSRRAFGMIAAVTTVIALSFSGASAATAAERVSFPGSVPKWATAVNDAGAAAPDTTVEGEIYLPLQQPAAAAAYATSVSTPGSADYRRFLTPDQWIAKYSPPQASVDAVVQTLNYLKLKVSGIPKSRQYVLFRGTAAQLGAAFQTSIHEYRFSGHVLAAPSSAPSVPASLASQVSGISVDQSKLLNHPHSVTQGDIPAPAAKTATHDLMTKATAPSFTAKCSHYFGEYSVQAPRAYGTTTFATVNCGYTPAQLRSAYGLDAVSKKGLNGSGQTVAIIDAYASPTIVSDVNTYSAQLGEPGLTAQNYSQVVPTPAEFVDQTACGGPSGWQGEQTLDVESVHGIATGAKILYVGGINCGGGLDLAMSKILDGKLANIVSNSYGNQGEAIPADAIAGQVNLQLQAAAEGIGLYYSSGDSGDEVANLGFASPDFPASSPWVTAVGGTSLGIDKSGSIAFETGWGTASNKLLADGSGYTSALPGNFLFGAGGGVSAVFAQPSYQKGIVPNSLAKGARVSPDISAVADPYTGFTVGLSPITNNTTLATGPFERTTYGGTSLASPVTAAQIAIVQQATSTEIGFANPTLYSLDRYVPVVFRDVKPLNPPWALAYTSAKTGANYLFTLDQDSSLRTTKGYDDVTGIGSVTFTLLSQVASGLH